MRSVSEADERLDAEALLDAFELEEAFARRDLTLPRWIRVGVADGRLAWKGRTLHLVRRRLAFRTPDLRPRHGTRYVVLRAVDTGHVVRLPFA